MTLIPTVIEKTKAWERAYDIYSRLLEDRIIFVWEEVHSAMANTIIAQMLFLEKKDPDKDVIMYALPSNAFREVVKSTIKKTKGIEYLIILLIISLSSFLLTLGSISRPICFLFFLVTISKYK